MGKEKTGWNNTVWIKSNRKIIRVITFDERSQSSPAIKLRTHNNASTPIQPLETPHHPILLSPSSCVHTDGRVTSDRVLCNKGRWGGSSSCGFYALNRPWRSC